ncbi:MAG TPA: permease [Methanoregulaceae archaeon]|nr:permease [Methanolinea sp.]MDD3090878.1 permease [Methanoregulaceae archaeon]MDD5048649.1 permease [Methanoregulaceae archaeon]MDD5685422.1 permease [Methanoregulaceae archaeon]HOP66975.1 permease [Methanoregulaceae archaeon]
MTDPITGAILSGVSAVVDYLAAHTMTCLVPAFFIAGAIAAFVKKEAILKYFSPDARKSVSYGIASISGIVLAVCSCTILPMFAGILKKGSGIGPAIAFLYSGPAINILAIIYTASVLGWDLGFARAAFAITMSIAIGLIMAALFSSYDQELRASSRGFVATGESEAVRPRWVVPLFFVFLVLILVIGASSLLDFSLRLSIVYFLTLGVALLLIYYFERDEVTEWGYEIWDLTKKIFPILVAGTFLVGIIAYFLPPETFRPFFGDNSVTACLLGSVVGTILYMPTLLEVPIIGGTFGYTQGVMAGGPALALLLSGPAVSLPSLLVLYRIMGARKTVVFAVLVIAFSTVAGLVYGNFFPALGIPGCGTNG